MGGQANHFTFAGQGTEGVFDTTSVTGEPIGSIQVDGYEGSDFDLSIGMEGLIARFVLDVTDGPGRAATVLLPDTNINDGAVPIEGLLVITIIRVSLGERDSATGPLQRFETRTIAGTASIVQS